MMNEDFQAKKMAYDQAQAGCATPGGSALGNSALNSCQEPTKDNLRQRIADQARRALQSSRKAEKLGELQYLLDKNPEVARILTLLDEVGA